YERGGPPRPKWHNTAWADGAGSREEAATKSYNESGRQKATTGRWRWSDDPLSLPTGIRRDEVNNRRWKPINQFWMDLQPNFQSTVRESFASDERVWLAELAKMYQQAYNDNYRDLGVRKFYETKRGDVKDHARELRSQIERE